jgi:hypothetical protein
VRTDQRWKEEEIKKGRKKERKKGKGKLFIYFYKL